MTSARENPTIIFPHIPKTGGTTVLYHFRTEFGEDAVETVGPYNAVTRFLDGERQFEEDNRPTYPRVIQGHGVNEKTIIQMPENGPK